VPVRVGVNSHDPTLYFLRQTGLLEEALAALGERVEWRTYSPGLRAPDFLGHELDFVGCGQTPAVKALADALPIAYVASTPSRPNQGALLVARDSGIDSPAQLRGCRVAVTIGAWPTQLLAVALDNAGASLRDVVPVAQGDDPLAALLAGEVAAWAALGPRLVEAEEDGRVRRLIPTESAVSNRHMWLAPRAFVDQHGVMISALVTAMERASMWVEANIAQAALRRASDGDPEAAAWGGDAGSWERTFARMPWGVIAIDERLIAEQQHAADVLLAAGWLERPARIADAFVPGLRELVEGAVREARAQPPPVVG